jgi:peptidoglycan biosynthesis/recognition FemAB-like protein
MDMITGTPAAGTRLRVDVASRADLAHHPHWTGAFFDQRKDCRHFELVEDTIRGFDYRYFVISNERGTVTAIQPFFFLDQDLLAASSEKLRALAERVRRVWPRFLTMRTLMVGCPAGEGHLDRVDSSYLRALVDTMLRHGRESGARLVVLKEFPARYRACLECFTDSGFVRMPSFPMTRLSIDYENFEDYMVKALSRRSRRDFRLKFKAAERGPKIEKSIVTDVTPFVDEVFPLYLAVYHRSQYHFEKLTKEYLCRLGRTMPDKVRFFIWRREGRIVAFTVCMLQGDEFYAEYIGLDYTVALDLHLYHYAIRDMIEWAIPNGFKWFCSSGLNYDPKFHLRCMLDPIDLYVRHTSPLLNVALKRLLPWFNPVYRDETLKRFPNYDELWTVRPGKPAEDPRKNAAGAAAPEAHGLSSG